MANSKFGYVKTFESDDMLPPSKWVLVRIKLCDFPRFSSIHEFEKPNDANFLKLMNSCAISLLDNFRDVILFAYGAGDLYSFVIHKKSQFYKRRVSKIVSLFVSYFSAVYVINWREFFPSKDLKEIPYFDGRAKCFPRDKSVRDYLARRQDICQMNYQYDACLWLLIKSGQTEKEAQLRLKGAPPKELCDMLFQQFEINYDNLHDMFRKGSFIFRKMLKETVKTDKDIRPVIKPRKIVTVVHVDIMARGFWNEHPYILQEDDQSTMENNNDECVEKWELNKKLPPANWIVVRIDGCRFHKFCSIHDFEKPNDVTALKLMNFCASSLLIHFPDVVFAYGASDEFSFVIKGGSDLCERKSSKIISLFVSYFTSIYVMKWSEFFPNKDLKVVPYFDCRTVCFPTVQNLRDYFAWRQIDCHINNQFNTCFWMMVRSGISKVEAQLCLKGTRTKEKYEILFQQFGIIYGELPEMFKKGSCVFKKVVMKIDDSGNPTRSGEIVTVDHVDLIGPKFWDEHPYILPED